MKIFKKDAKVAVWYVPTWTAPAPGGQEGPTWFKRADAVQFVAMDEIAMTLSEIGIPYDEAVDVAGFLLDEPDFVRRTIAMAESMVER